MIDMDIYPCMEDVSPRMTYVADDPIDFKTWLELAQDRDTELIRGVMVDRIAVPYQHEWIFAWLSVS